MIALDIDNTVAATLEGLRVILAERLGICPDDLHATGNYHRPLVPKNLCHDPISPDGAALEQAYKGIWDLDELCRIIPPVPGAREVVEDLKQDGLLAGYVTRRPSAQYRVTREWLRRWGFTDAPLLHAPHPPGGTRQCKSLSMDIIGAFVLIDDHHAEVQSVIQAGRSAVLLDAPEFSWRPQQARASSGLPDKPANNPLPETALIWQPTHYPAAGWHIQSPSLENAAHIARGICASGLGRVFKHENGGNA